MTTTLNVSAAPIQPFAIGGNALQMGSIDMQEIVGSQGPEPLISKNPAWHMQASASTSGYAGPARGCSGCEGDLDERKHPCLELRQLWEDDAWQLLWDTLDRAFGGLPAGIATQPAVRRATPGKVLAGLARQPGDILVIGAGRRGRPRQFLCRRVSRYCLAHADCPVLAIPPPALARHAGHRLRGWAFRSRGLDPGHASLPIQTP